MRAAAGASAGRHTRRASLPAWAIIPHRSEIRDMPQQALKPADSGGAQRTSTLQALVTIARRLGFEASAEQLQRTYALDAGEPTSDVIIAIARDMGLEARSLVVKFRDLPNLAKALPAILRAKDGSALVLEGASVDPSKGAIAILRDPADPSATPIAIDEIRLADVWSGEIILVKRRYGLTDDEKPFGLSWIFGQVLRERRLFVDIGAAAVIATMFALAPPFAFMIVIDRVLTNQSYSTLAVIAGAMGMLIVFETVLGYLRRKLTEVATTRIDGRLNLYILEKLLKLPMDYFERNPTGKIASKLQRIWQVRHFLTGQLFGVFLDAVPLLGIVPALLILEWRLAAIVFAATGAVFVIVMLSLGPVGRRFRRVVVAEQAKNAHLLETIYGIRTIKSLAIEGRRRREWDVRVAEAAEARHEMGLTANVPQTFSLPFERLIYSGTVMTGAYLVLSEPDSISVGTLIAFALLSMRLAHPLIQIAKLQSDLAEVRGAISEVASIMNAPAEETRGSKGLRLPIHGEISFQDVRFRYSPDAPFALDGVSFTLSKGKMLGIVGRSGSGKTTLTRLLNGLHSGYEGLIKIDGMDLREIDLHHLRTSIGVVLQDNFLFSGSIRDNIAMASPDASFSQIVRAAQLAGAEEFIERLPRGYDTVLEEGAANLSGGQRQRLAIARALLVNPPVLMLDEATSALDAESEAIVNANLRKIGVDRSIICISHRLSMLVQADQIMVMERGRVYDIGTHEELLARCDIYKHLWHQQNSHVSRTAAALPRLTRVENK
jgi:ATP-binding cassette, subfamily B, bacterial HlyB/CyaB